MAQEGRCRTVGECHAERRSAAVMAAPIHTPKIGHLGWAGPVETTPRPLLYRRDEMMYGVTFFDVRKNVPKKCQKMYTKYNENRAENQ